MQGRGRQSVGKGRNSEAAPGRGRPAHPRRSSGGARSPAGRGPTGLARAALLALALGLAGAPARADAPESDHAWVGVDKCGRCHKKELLGNQVEAWREGPHARAFRTLRTEASRRIARELGLPGPPEEAAECLTCHASAFEVPAERLAYPLELEDGVQCESCHGPGRDYRKKTIMSDRERAVGHGLWEADRDPDVCLRCHNEASPTFDPARYRLPDGTTTGFDFEQARQRIRHPIPKEVKGRYLEVEKKLRDEKRARGG